MKNIITKVLTSALALTLVATSAVVATAPKTEVPAEETKALAIVETIEAKEDAKSEIGIIAAIEAKAKEEAIAKIEKAEAPALEIAKAEPVAKMVAEKAAEEVAAPEIIVAPAEEAAPEIEPEMVWDISATAEDNVAMAFYAAPEEAEDGVSFEDLGSSVVYITGEGYMADAIYTHFMSAEKFAKAAEENMETYYKVDVETVYDETITDVLELDANIRYFNAATGEELFVTEDVRRAINPATFMEYSPEVVYIDGDVKNISDFAFLLCHDLRVVYLTASIETIGEYAFEFCTSLESIIIPETAELSYGTFAYCSALKYVKIVDADEIGTVTFSDDLEDFDFDNPPEGYLTATAISHLVYDC